MPVLIQNAVDLVVKLVCAKEHCTAFVLPEQCRPWQTPSQVCSRHIGRQTGRIFRRINFLLLILERTALGPGIYAVRHGRGQAGDLLWSLCKYVQVWAATPSAFEDAQIDGLKPYKGGEELRRAAAVLAGPQSNKPPSVRFLPRSQSNELNGNVQS